METGLQFSPHSRISASSRYIFRPQLEYFTASSRYFYHSWASASKKLTLASNMSDQSQTKIAKRHRLIPVLTGSGSAIFFPSGSGLTECRKVRHSIRAQYLLPLAVHWPLLSVTVHCHCPLSTALSRKWTQLYFRYSLYQKCKLIQRVNLS